MKRARPVYCRTPDDWDRIRARAKSVGKSVSEFVMTCALQDAPPPSTSPLVLTPEEQRDLLRNVNDLCRRLSEMFFVRADGDPALVDAVALLYRLHLDELEYNPQEAQE
ncbi:plasmid mobilization protein [Ruegeria sp.]|uniref:plasmid mobilization protein n=1 Tax=Ruegeria sp. TaxID=1879320 RepID=UPI003C7CCCE1